MNTQTIVAVGIIAVTLTLPIIATASIPLDKDGKVKLFGDVPLRIEADDREKQSGTTDNPACF